MVEVSPDGDLGDPEDCCQLLDICFAGFGQSFEYRLFSFLKIHVIHLFLNKIDQK